MARTRTEVRLTDQLVELLDQEANRRGISRSAVIREALDRHLFEDREWESSHGKRTARRSTFYSGWMPRSAGPIVPRSPRRVWCYDVATAC